MKTRTVLTAILGVLAFFVIAPSVSAEGEKPAEKQVEKPAQEPAAKPEEKKPAKSYPLDVCIVSDEKLGGMGKPVSFVYEGKEIKLCCKSCRKDFDEDPATYLKKLEGK